MQIEEIKSLLAERLSTYKAQDPDKFSYAYFANKSDTSNSYIERAIKNQLGDVLDSKKILAVAKMVCAPEETQEIAQYFAGKLLEESSILKDAIYAKFIKENERFVSSEFEKIFLEDDSYITYCLCCNGKGASEAHISKVLGEKGLVALDKLRSRGLVLAEGENFKAIQTKFSYSFEYISKFISLLAKFYQPNNVGKKRNYAHVVTHNLSRNGVKLWQAEHRRHHDELRKIRDAHTGDIDVFSVGFMDTFTSEDIDSPKITKSTKDSVMKNIGKALMSLALVLFALTSSKVIASETIFEVKGSLKQELSAKFKGFESKDSIFIDIKEIDLIRAIENDGKFELESATTLDGIEFYFRDFTPVKRVIGGEGTDGGGG